MCFSAARVEAWLEAMRSAGLFQWARCCLWLRALVLVNLRSLSRGEDLQSLLLLQATDDTTPLPSSSSIPPSPLAVFQLQMLVIQLL
jgi:hypothetical protein